MRTLTLFAALFILLHNGCTTESNPVTPSVDKIETGSYTPAATGSVGSGGGRIDVTTGPVAGLSIEVPQGALGSPWTFTVSSAEIKKHSYGPDINPISPMIRIECNSEYSELPMTLTVPITLPPGHFAMGFFYDAETGELEGIPVVLLDDKKIVLVTRHFSGRFLSGGNSGGIQGSRPFVEILISAIQMNQLQGMFETGFQTKVDDWDFVNLGSYIAPGGHCSGQSITAMWYYHERKKRAGDPPLYRRFDLVSEELRHDNPRGYRFASVNQKDQTWTAALNWFNFFTPTGNGKIGRDSLHYFTFVYAIKVLARPQYVAIFNATGGHAMIVYRAGNGVLCVADPNYPGISTRVITLNALGRFDPYLSGPTAAQLGTPYPNIGYYSRSALISHVGIAARYAQMLQGTIGTVAPNTFPEVTLQMLEKGNWVPVPDTISSEIDTLRLRSFCPTCGITYPGTVSSLQLRDDKGNVLEENNNQGILTKIIGGGTTTLNVSIFGTTTAGVTSYITFRKIVVKKQQGAMFLYWLKGVVNEKDTIHFGAKNSTFNLPGTWNGTTFTIDITKTVTDDQGNQAPVTGKMTFRFSNDMSMITSYDAYMHIFWNGGNYITTDMSGKNVPRTVNSVSEMIYEIEGPSTCSSITRMDMKKFLTTLKEWSCDDSSFVRIRIVK